MTLRADYRSFESTRRYLERHGKPMAFYSDKHCVFRVNAKDAKAGDGYTQFGRALSELNMDIFYPNTPAAKGRVERANQTLQDRLVKELRLRDISSVEAGNAYLEEFAEDYNRRFAREPQSAHSAHRPLLVHRTPYCFAVVTISQAKVESWYRTCHARVVRCCLAGSMRVWRFAGELGRRCGAATLQRGHVPLRRHRQATAQATSDVIYDWNMVKNTLWLSAALTSNFGYRSHPSTLEWWITRIHPGCCRRRGRQSARCDRR